MYTVLYYNLSSVEIQPFDEDFNGLTENISEPTATRRPRNTADLIMFNLSET